MASEGRPAEMSDLEWLVALEELRQLKARRDRYVDAHDWDAYQALHAPDHVSYHADVPGADQPVAWTSSEEMIRNVRKIMTETHSMTMHHSYDAEIVFDTPTKARAIWAMTAAQVAQGADGEPSWQITYGNYYETYEKRDGRWLFTTRRWHRYLATGSDGVVFPQQPIQGSDAFAATDGAFGRGPG